MDPQERRERIIKIVHDVEAARRKLQELEAELDSLLGPQQPIAKVVFLKDASLPDRVIAFFKANPGAWDAKAMLSHLGLKSEQIAGLRSTLGRLASEGRISKHSRGKYTALQKADAASNSGSPAAANGAS